MKEKLFLVLKKFYKKIPINHGIKIKLKNLFYKIFAFAYKDTIAYQLWNLNNIKDVRVDVFTPDKDEVSKFNFNKKLVIQLHLYYIDLIFEFKEYFKNIPFKFDLFISVVEDKEKNYIVKEFGEIDNLNKIIVKKVENRGRDVAPLVSTFGKDILEYDYVIHVHTKKSLFTGGEQTEWRKYLLDSLIGNIDIVKSHFYMLEKGDSVGLIYPETYYSMPYYGHTWLKNKASRDELLKRINIPFRDEKLYIDYPMGTMFIAKVDAVKNFFDAEIRTSEFPKESGQIDGTIAHAFERCLSIVSNFNSYNTLIYDRDEKNYVYNSGRKNIKQYYIKSYDQLKKEIELYDVISFDIFDTLVNRKITFPEILLDLVEKKVNQKYSDKLEFKELRLRAEESLRIKKPSQDPDTEDIYNEIKRTTNWKDDEIEIIKNLELEVEKELIIPNTYMIEILKYAKVTLRKEVNLISDMHLEKEFLIDVLEKNGIEKELYNNIYLSSELNVRKDNELMWKYYLKNHNALKCLHIGDNEVSDCQIPGDNKIATYHILSPKALFELTDLGNEYGSYKFESLEESIQYGMIFNKLFSNPFKYNKDRMKVKIDNPKTFGYSIIAPVLVNYILWLNNEKLKLDSKKILFLSREGYLLKKVYDIMYPKEKDIVSKYLYVSRRALSNSSIYNIDDVDPILEIFYDGTISNLMKKRFDIIFESEEKIMLPRDKNMVKKILSENSIKILENSKVERNNYLSYVSDVLLESKKENNILLADIGYSGTIQYFLSKITKREYDGRYMMTDNKNKPIEIEGNSIVGYYDDSTMQEITKSNIHKYHLLFESILISPDAQLVKMGKNGNPIFENEYNQLYTEVIKEIHDGILEFTEEYYKYLREYELINIPNKEIAEKIIGIIVENKMISEDLEKALFVEDLYCSSSEINVFNS